MLCMQHQPEACASDLGGDQSRYLYEKKRNKRNNVYT